jgi:DNA-binding transcriptional LysR family regulator
MRYFVAVAEELHFTRAAERLHMAQQPLSAAIARLEQQLGFKLLERNTRRVELTEAGEAFLEAARSALAAADAAVDVAQAAAKGLSGEVAIGMSAGAWYGLGELFARLRADHPGLRLHVRQQSSQPLARAVGAGELDLAVGLCVPPDAPLERHRLKDEPVVLVVAGDHALAGQQAVALADAREARFALDDPAEGPGYNAAVVALCEAAGFTPAVREVQTHHDAWERAIAAGELVGLTTSCSLHAAHPGVRAIPVMPAATFPLDLLARPGERRPAVQTVIDTALATAGVHGWLSASAD